MANGEAVAGCEAFAAGNHGVVPRDLAIAKGLDRHAIHRLVRSGRWRKAGPKALIVAGVPESWHMKLAATAACLGDGFAFSHRTAGRLWRLDGVTGDRIDVVASRAVALDNVV